MADQTTRNGQMARDLAYEIFEMPGGPSDPSELEDFIEKFLNVWGRSELDGEAE